MRFLIPMIAVIGLGGNAKIIKKQASQSDPLVQPANIISNIDGDSQYTALQQQQEKDEVLQNRDFNQADNENVIAGDSENFDNEYDGNSNEDQQTEGQEGIADNNLQNRKDRKQLSDSDDGNKFNQNKYSSGQPYQQGESTNLSNSPRSSLRKNAQDEQQIQQRTDKQTFQEFQKIYDKTYNQEQQALRYNIFKQNKKIVQQHNSKGNDSYDLGLNGFGDLTNSQFQSIYFMVPDEEERKLAERAVSLQGTQSSPINDFGPTKINPINWRNKVEFAPIKDQGKCAACYAFSIIGAIQITWAYYNKEKSPSLSEQQIIDCCQSSGYQCNGCINGKMGSTFNFLADQGIALSLVYPYTGKANKCSNFYFTNKYLNKKSSYQQVQGVQSAIFYLKKGPLAVGIDSRGWKLYKRGVFTGCVKRDFKYSHSVVIYGVERDGTWLIRNSWGPKWGENGYMKLAPGNSCGLTNFVFLPIVIT